MKLKYFLRDYMSFTRKERIGIIVILFIMFFLWLLPKIFSYFHETNKLVGDTTWIVNVRMLEKKEELNSLKATHEEKKQYSSNDKFPVSTYSENSVLFYFDPNTITAKDWKKLGLRDKTIQTIENYLRKGGHFFSPTDLEKIYGLNKNEYKRLEPYIRILPLAIVKKVIPFNSNFKNDGRDNLSLIDINTADSTTFVSLPGIGIKLASRIINFRNNLGGFYSIEQIKEIYGLQDSTFLKIKPRLTLNDNTVKKINVNTSDKEELKNHPYIHWTIANAIIEFRNRHGKFSTLKDLKQIILITDEIYNRITPYLSVE